MYLQHTWTNHIFLCLNSFLFFIVVFSLYIFIIPDSDEWRVWASSRLKRVPPPLPPIPPPPSTVPPPLPTIPPPPSPHLPVPAVPPFRPLLRPYKPAEAPGERDCEQLFPHPELDLHHHPLRPEPKPPLTTTKTLNRFQASK